MSEIDPTIDLAHLANLARLNFDPNTTESARTDLEKIITMINVMQDVDTVAEYHRDGNLYLSDFTMSDFVWHGPEN